jgi:osmoprotectant transport system permease protein
LGVYIFRGLRQYDNNLLLAGALSAALLALLADFSLGLVERGLSVSAERKSVSSARRKLVFAAAVVLVVAGLAVWWSRGNTDQTEKVTIGSKDFTESALLAEIVAQMLEARGVTVERRFELGGNLPHEALVSGTLDLYPEYTGTCYTGILHHDPITDPRAVYNQVKQEFADKFKVEVSPPAGFENTFAILVRGEEARRLNLKTISDAAPHTTTWRAGFGQDFMSRQDGYPGFSKSYGLKFSEVREMDLSLTYIALSSRQVDLIAGNSTEGRIQTLDLFQLADDRHYFPPYEAVYLVRQDTLARVPALREVITQLGNAISTDEMRRLNYEVDGNKRDPKEVVREWIGGKR